jgi:hypothetical protein
VETSVQPERTLVAQLDALVHRAAATPRDPTVHADLASVGQQIRQDDAVLQATTCPPDGAEYLRTVQIASSDLREAIGLYALGLVEQNANAVAAADQKVQNLLAQWAYASSMLHTAHIVLR